MSVAKEIPELQALVMGLLQKDKRLRESDKKLSARVWSMQLGGLDNTKTMTAYDFFVRYVDDNSVLYSQESIGRCRRKLQELYPELRGENYKEKQAEQGAVISELRGMEPEKEEPCAHEWEQMGQGDDRRYHCIKCHEEVESKPMAQPTLF